MFRCTAGQYAALSLSPDGQVLVFVAQKPGGALQLYMRRLDQLEAVPLSGTDGANSPFFSPDGQWVAFNVGGKLKKVSVTGGAAVEVGDAPCCTRRCLERRRHDDHVLTQPQRRFGSCIVEWREA